jgi:hypothetical protein
MVKRFVLLKKNVCIGVTVGSKRCERIDVTVEIAPKSLVSQSEASAEIETLVIALYCATSVGDP